MTNQPQTQAPAPGANGPEKPHQHQRPVKTPTPHKPGTGPPVRHGCGCGSPDTHGCGSIELLTRLRYFHGQPIGAHDLRSEQGYHLEKDRLRNRLLHGWGIMCGLDVTVTEKKSCLPGEDDPTITEVIVLPGAALDCVGNEVVVRHPRPVLVASLLEESERERLREQPGDVYLTLCYREVLADPMRPMLAHGCDPAPDCEYGRVVESYQVCASTTPPEAGPACEPCCGACGDSCLLLATIRDFDPTQPLRDEQVDLAGRRSLALHPFATITGINWVHGATYSRDDVNALLDRGLRFTVSRGVRVDTLRAGVVELTAIESDSGRSGSIYNIEGEFDGLPSDGFVEEFTYRRVTGETLQLGDRLLVTLRGDFVLDECCRALDGNHIGGGVPVTASDYTPVETLVTSSCLPRPSGDGTEGGDFVSWLYVTSNRKDAS